MKVPNGSDGTPSVESTENVSLTDEEIVPNERPRPTSSLDLSANGQPRYSIQKLREPPNVFHTLGASLLGSTGRQLENGSDRGDHIPSRQRFQQRDQGRLGACPMQPRFDWKRLGRSLATIGRQLPHACSKLITEFGTWLLDSFSDLVRRSSAFVRRYWVALLLLALAGVGLALLGRLVFEPLSWKGWFTFAVLLLLLASLICSWLPTEVSFAYAVVTLMAFFVISPAEGLIGFSNTGVAAVAVYFMVAEGVYRTSALRTIFRILLGRPSSLLMAQVRTCLPAAVVSAFLHNTPTMVMMIPGVQRWARFNGLSGAKILMPLNDAAVLGGSTTIIGSSVNLVVLGLVQQTNVLDPATNHVVQFGIFSITKLAIINLAACLVFIFVFSGMLLKDRENVVEDVVEHPREYTVAVMVREGSPIVGLTIQEAGLRALKGLFLVELSRKNGNLIAAPGPDTVIQAQDVLLFAGRLETVAELYLIDGIIPASTHTRKLSVQMHRRRLYEVVVSPFSSLVGHTIRETNFRRKYHAAIIAVHRGGAIVREKIGDIQILGGETFIVEASEDFGERYARDSDFSLVSEVSGTERPREDLPHMLAAGLFVVLMIAFATTGFMSIFVSASLATIGMLITGCMTFRQAGASVQLPILLTIGAAFGISEAMQVSGVAAQLSLLIVKILRPLGSIGILFGIYVITALLTNAITSIGAVTLTFAIVASKGTGIIYLTQVNVYAALYTMMVAGNCSFMLHTGHQTNLMVHGAANYRVSDWLKLGVPLQLVSCIVTVVAANFLYRS
jgi:di/tricarboxylate transporter